MDFLLDWDLGKGKPEPKKQSPEDMLMIFKGIQSSQNRNLERKKKVDEKIAARKKQREEKDLTIPRKPIKKEEK